MNIKTEIALLHRACICLTGEEKLIPESIKLIIEVIDSLEYKDELIKLEKLNLTSNESK